MQTPNDTRGDTEACAALPVIADPTTGVPSTDTTTANITKGPRTRFALTKRLPYAHPRYPMPAGRQCGLPTPGTSINPTPALHPLRVPCEPLVPELQCKNTHSPGLSTPNYRASVTERRPWHDEHHPRVARTRGVSLSDLVAGAPVDTIGVQ